MITDDPSLLYRRPLRGAVVRHREPAGLAQRASDSDTTALAGRLAAVGWQTATLGPVSDLAGFYAEMAAGLRFPHYFGANLDALWDALRSLRTPTAVIIGWATFAASDPTGADRVLPVLDQRSDIEPPFAAVLD